MKSEFIGVAMGETQTIAISMVKSKKGVIIKDAIVEKRQDSLMNDCKHLVSKYSLEDKLIGITALGERQDKVMIIPPLSRLEINQMLHWSVPEFVTWPEDSYYFDFVAINLPNQVRSSGNDKLVYVVALKKEHINELATGVLKSGGNLKIIDYAPGPIAHRFVEKEGAVIGIIHEDILELTAWYNFVCICNHKIQLESVDIMKELEDLEVDLFSYGISGISGFYLYGDIQGNLSDDDCAAAYEKYGTLTRIPFESHEEVSKTENLISDPKGKFLWDMALGLAYRGVQRMKN